MTNSSTLRGLFHTIALSPLLALVAYAQTAPESTVTLPSLQVTEQAENGAPPSLQEAKAALGKVAGATSLVDSSVAEKGRVATAADLLAYQPGVFAQSTGGQDALRISIRGSGINRGQGSFREGITFLFDGLALTGAGGSPFELFEPLGVNYTEILKGANGFSYGGVALGGVINYVTKTGYDASPFEARLELGSFGYHKAQVASGGVNGKADYYATVIGTERDGFQALSNSKSARVIANFGYQLTENISNRLYFRYGATDFENPGSLKLAQLRSNPAQANPTNITNAANPLLKSSRLQQGSTWIGDKLTVKSGPDSNLDLGAVFHDYPIDIRGGGSRSIWADDDVSLSGRYTYTGDLFNHNSVTIAGVATTTELIGNVKTYTNNSLAAPTQTRDYAGSANYVAYASNELELIPKLWSSLAGQLIYIHREADYPFTATPQADDREYDRDVVRFAPRLGLRYDVTPAVQVFGNISHAVEPADSWKYNGIRVANTTAQVWNGWTDLKEQTSTTAELGTRFKKNIFEGSLVVYRSWIKDELLTVIDPVNPSLGSTNSNASPTVHQGIELGLDTTLWQEGGAAVKPTEAPHRVLLRQAYTYNNFEYEHDSLYGKNELPGLPRQFYQGEVVYEHPSGFYAGVSAQLSSSYYVDYANTYSAPGYVIWGAKLGYVHPKHGWEVYLDFKNLTDKNYVTAVSPTYNAGGVDVAVFQPGDGFSVFSGVSYKF